MDIDKKIEHSYVFIHNLELDKQQRINEGWEDK